MRQHLTEASVRAFKPVPGKQVRIWDASTPGFGVLVNDRSKSFIVMYGEKRTLKVIGRFPDVGLADARKQARRISLDPIEKTDSISFLDARAEFLEKHGAHLRPSTLYQLQRTLKRHFNWSKPLDEINVRDIIVAVDAIKAKGEATHALKDLKTFFTWCVPRYLKFSPCHGIRPPARYIPRSRVPSENEVRRIWDAASQIGGSFGPFCHLLIVSGQRFNQIASLQWDWINTNDRTISFPATVMKGNRDHTIPYGELTAAIIDSVPQVGDLLFPARRADKPMVSQGKIKARLDKLSGVKDHTFHDLRRSYAVAMQSLGVPVEVIETLLAHRSGVFGGIVGIYQRHTFKTEMREAVEKYEAHLKRSLARTVDNGIFCPAVMV